MELTRIVIKAIEFNTANKNWEDLIRITISDAINLIKLDLTQNKPQFRQFLEKFVARFYKTIQESFI